MKLPKTDAQMQYHIVLKHVESGLSYVELRKIVKQKWIDHLREWGILKQGAEIEGTGRSTFTFEMTTKGQLFYQALESDCLFDSALWTDHFVDYFDMYCKGGDLQALYPVALFAFRTDVPSLTGHHIDIATSCLSTDNGYLHMLANLYLSYGADCLNWMHPKHSSQNEWLENGTSESKVITLRLSQVGADALERVVAKLESQELKTGYRSWKAGEGFSAELGLIALASLLDTLL